MPDSSAEGVIGEPIKVFANSTKSSAAVITTVELSIDAVDRCGL